MSFMDRAIVYISYDRFVELALLGTWSSALDKIYTVLSNAELALGLMSYSDFLP